MIPAIPVVLQSVLYVHGWSSEKQNDTFSTYIYTIHVNQYLWLQILTLYRSQQLLYNYMPMDIRNKINIVTVEYWWTVGKIIS